MNQLWDWAVPYRLTQLQKAWGYENVEWLPHTLTLDTRAAAGGPGVGTVSPNGISPEFGVTTPDDAPWWWFGTSNRDVNLLPQLRTMWRVKITATGKYLGNNHAMLAADNSFGWMPLANTVAAARNYRFLWPYPIGFQPYDQFTVQWQDPRNAGAGTGFLILAFHGYKAFVH